MSRRAGWAISCAVALFLVLPLGAASSPEPPLGRLLAPQQSHLVVRSEPCQCDQSDDDALDIVLFTLGSESTQNGESHFHPIASFAFDRSLSDTEPGQWIGMWVYGTAGAGWRRNVRSFFPFPAGVPSASEKKLERLDARIEEIRSNPEDADLMVPDPVVNLANVGKAGYDETFWGGLRRGLKWAGVFNPAQFVYRSYLVRRDDREEREFKRAYLALQWLVDLEYDGAEEAPWFDTANELRFHLLRNKSFFGRWLEHADSVEFVFNYESGLRGKLTKGTAWLQSAANEHLLRYEPIYRYTANGARVPVGGVLYYDPRLHAQPDPGWWKQVNPFDLRYNPHTDPEVQRLAKEHPDELIPLAIYTLETSLPLRPIIAVDFFSPGNPQTRERNQQLMVMAREWLSITTGALDLERIPYRLTAWAANKKSFTFLVDKNSPKGVEELRLALEANLYFESTYRAALERLADRRVLNPLVKAIPEEERLAHLQYESLWAGDDRPLCDTLREIRENAARRLKMPDGGDAETRRAELKHRLEVWRQEMRLADFVSQPLEDYGSLASLNEPLNYFRENKPLDAKKFGKLLAKLDAKLYRQQLRLPADHEVPALTAALELTRAVWEQNAASPRDFARRRSEVESKVAQKHQGELAKQEKKRRELLLAFLKETREKIANAEKAGCDAQKAYTSNLESHLAILQDVLSTALEHKDLQAEVDSRRPALRQELAALDSTLSQCSIETEDSWLAESHQSSLELIRGLEQVLSGKPQLAASGSH